MFFSVQQILPVTLCLGVRTPSFYTNLLLELKQCFPIVEPLNFPFLHSEPSTVWFSFWFWFWFWFISPIISPCRPLLWQPCLYGGFNMFYSFPLYARDSSNKRGFSLTSTYPNPIFWLKTGAPLFGRLSLFDQILSFWRALLGTMWDEGHPLAIQVSQINLESPGRGVL